MADLKITGLTALTAPADADLFVIVDDVSGTATTKKITLANSLKGVNITTSLGIQGAVATPGILLLSTLETTVVDGDKLGQINFQAPSEASGTDAILVAASIWAEADGTFANNLNSTSIVIATGTTDTAAEIVRINNTGMTLTTGLTTAGAILNLSTNEPSVVDGDVLGRIDFQAPLDTGIDSDIVAASVYAESDATFSDTVNTTSIVFATGTTSTPIERVRIGNTVGITVAANTTGLSIAACSATAINITAKCQDTEAGLDTAAIFRHGTYTTPIAYGVITADHLILKSMHITGTATGKYIFGNYQKIDTEGNSTGYIHLAYNAINVGHALANGYAGRNKIDITATSALGEMAGVLGECVVAASTTITGTAGGTLNAGLFDLTITAAATVAQNANALLVRPQVRANVAGETTGIRIDVNCTSANYTDYGLDIVSMSSNQSAAIRIFANPASDALACGIWIEGDDTTTSTITNAISFVGTVTNAFDFAESDGSQAAVVNGTYSSGYDETPSGSIKVDVAGATKYIYLHDTVIAVT